MKWGKWGALLACLPLLAACQSKQVPEEQPTPSPTPSALLQASVVRWYDTSLLLAGVSGQAGDVYLVPYEEIPLLDEKGNHIEPGAVQTGSIVAISYDGLVRETFPAGITPSSIQVQEKRPSVITLYEQVIGDLYAQGPALNADIRYMAFDLTQVSNLTEAEKSAFVYLLGNAYRKEALQGTFQSLCEAGYINKEKLYFESGVLFEIADEGLTGQTVHFSASKWRSGLGAIGLSNCVATLSGDTWTYEVGSNWIS
jgi:hypothetical protein